jgi:hypothetical protein
MGTRRVLARQTTRIGQQVLWEEGGRYFVATRNRTSRSKVEVPADRVPLWMASMGASAG